MSSGWIAMDFHVWNSRDYTLPEIKEPEKVEKESSGPSLALITNASLIGIFTLVLIILVIRTFRGKAEV